MAAWLAMKCHAGLLFSTLLILLPLSARMQAPAMDHVMAPTASVAAHYVPSGVLDLKQVLPMPPAQGSLAGQADLEAVLQAQAWRTPEQVAWALAVEKGDVFANAAVLGGWFTKENLPATAELFKNIGEDVRALGEQAKKVHLRDRPFKFDARVQPCVTASDTNSYPSVHATSAFVWAAVLAEIFPEKQAELFERAHRMAWSRVLGGVHFPSDVVGGRLLAEALVAELKKNAAFAAALERARAEVVPWQRKKAA
jgi:acid phosphatase (class A)